MCPPFSRRRIATRWLTGLSSATRMRSRQARRGGLRRRRVDDRRSRCTAAPRPEPRSARCCLTGLTRYAATPSSRQRAASPCRSAEVSIRMGVPASAGSALIALATSNPSMPGIMASSRMARYRGPPALWRSSASAATPQSTAVGDAPQSLQQILEHPAVGRVVVDNEYSAGRADSAGA